MASMMESRFTAEQHALIRKVLVAQTASAGVAETPIVEELLKRQRRRTLLDIGCGEGSFLLRLAEKLRSTRFVGIDHSELAIADARRRLRRKALRNVTVRTAFFDRSFDRTSYDAITTRYTLQHSSEPVAFVKAVFDRLNKQGSFVSIESLDTYTDCHLPDPVWGRFRSAIAAVHQRAGSNDNLGKSLGSLLRGAGFRDIQVRAVLCSPSTIGTRRFQAVIRASADLAVSFFPDLFDRRLRVDLETWLADRRGLEERDPYLCTAIANGTRP